MKSSSENVVQAGIIETCLSGYQLIFCDRKIKREKPNKYNYLIFRSLKSLSTEIYEEAHSTLTHTDITSKMLVVVKKVAPTKTITINAMQMSGLMERLLKKEPRGKLKIKSI